MNKIFAFVLVSIFAIFVGSQITEGALLVPYWKALPAKEFNEYYEQFGKEIGRFYTILTIIAALVPLYVSIFCFIKKSRAARPALVSLIFALAFLAAFYIYFKGTNEQFYAAAFTEDQLRSELVTWGKWHWSRVLIEVLSLIFLIQALSLLTNPEKN